MTTATTRAACALAALIAAAPLPAQTFDFESTALGTATPFSVTAGGLTATFASPDPFAFVVDLSFFKRLVGNVLLDADDPSHTLLLSFSRPLSAISLDFALNTEFPSTMQLAAYLGGTLVGTASAAATIPVGQGPAFYPEGVMAFAGGPFDVVALSSVERDFAIDNVRVAQAPVTTPEPAPLALLASALAPLGVAARRRAKRVPEPRGQS